MQQVQSNSRAGLWTGRVLKAMIVLFLLFDAVMKIIRHSKSVQATEELGLPASSVPILGFYLFLSTILYIVPRTALLGCLFITAYLGGAAAVTFAAGNDLFSYIFPIAFAVFMWVAEYMRNQKVRASFPLLK